MDRVKESYIQSKAVLKKLKNKVKFLTENLYKNIRTNELVDALLDFDSKELYFETEESKYRLKVSENGYSVRIEENDCYEDFNFFNFFQILENTKVTHPYYEKLKNVLDEVNFYIPKEVNIIRVDGLFFDICFTNPINMYFTSTSESRFIYYRKKGEIIEKLINLGGKKDISIIPFPLVSITIKMPIFSRRYKDLKKIIEDIKMDKILSRNHKISKVKIGRSKTMLIHLY